jgi:mono/diheme cytochrome c family protein
MMRLTNYLRLVGLFFLGVFLFYVFWPTETSAQDPDDEELLSDPLILGAWLYEGHCVRCHGSYKQERVGTDYTDEDELFVAIESEECRISWGRQHGGSLRDREIKALVRYIMTWEELDGPPDLPELPPQPTPSPTPTKPLAEEAAATPSPTPTPELMDERTKQIVSSNVLAHGAWLYTQHCFRCHQAYESTRMGRGITIETLQTTIENGKTSTQMTPFSRKNGGPLKDREIEAIVHYMLIWEELEASPALPAGVIVEPTPDPADLMPITLPEVPLVEGNPQQGAELFTLYCVECHGPAGEGYIGPRLVKSWRSIRPDLTIKSTIIQGVPGSPMPAWSEVEDGPLSEQEINDLVAFILNRSPETKSTNVVSTTSSSPLRGPWGLMMLIIAPVVLGLVSFVRGASKQ